LLQHARDRHRALQAAPLIANWPHLRAQECADEATQGCHRAAGLATGDSRNGLLLLRCGPFVKNKANRPVPLAHHAWRRADDSEIEAIQRQTPILTLVDMKR